eukprot:TRINITY_DN62018_c0_g2_i1.p2 TRINITY_DN62018_c0_g2~~TRINITY_DN62018_c0_g2_i1.p2  ORF type:complete len:345 (+),score=44.30 TRINITY_DN62018_c0_g2_i1:80-1114(+)
MQYHTTNDYNSANDEQARPSEAEILNSLKVEPLAVYGGWMNREEHLAHALRCSPRHVAAQQAPRDGVGSDLFKTINRLDSVLGVVVSDDLLDVLIQFDCDGNYSIKPEKIVAAAETLYKTLSLVPPRADQIEARLGAELAQLLAAEQPVTPTQFLMLLDKPLDLWGEYHRALVDQVEAKLSDRERAAIKQVFYYYSKNTGDYTDQDGDPIRPPTPPHFTAQICDEAVTPDATTPSGFPLGMDSATTPRSLRPTSPGAKMVAVQLSDAYASLRDTLSKTWKGQDLAHCVDIQMSRLPQGRDTKLSMNDFHMLCVGGPWRRCELNLKQKPHVQSLSLQYKYTRGGL